MVDKMKAHVVNEWMQCTDRSECYTRTNQDDMLLALEWAFTLARTTHQSSMDDKVGFIDDREHLLDAHQVRNARYSGATGYAKQRHSDFSSSLQVSPRYRTSGDAHQSNSVFGTHYHSN